MREIGFEHKLVSLLNFFIFNYKLDYHKLVNTVSGLDADAEAKIAEAQAKMDEAQDALEVRGQMNWCTSQLILSPKRAWHRPLTFTKTQHLCYALHRTNLPLGVHQSRGRG